ncbi:MGMT family protein [Variovorax sp. J22P240]|uniref:MGMT family protein n=1 Tax=unclassified Variovorax TaxID=663243 RepID=UPI002574C759|nr:MULTISPECIES: MGMT family protein [unclassified Variovorax]MDL9997121.1 MGMT family protein [Variovorax sp. J22P240]MDM0048242.1 MGMT family protein [Variovorax sp. J22R115]
MGSAIARNGKSWRERLAGYPTLPDIKPIPERMQQRHGHGTIVTPSPREVDQAMKRVPEGRLVTVFGIGQQLALQHGTTIGCTVTTAIFASMAAQAAEEDRQAGVADITPYWRTLKANGELNLKYPGGLDELMQRLESEGHTVVQRGRRYFVEDFEKKLMR